MTKKKKERAGLSVKSSEVISCYILVQRRGEKLKETTDVCEKIQLKYNA